MTSSPDTQAGFGPRYPEAAARLRNEMAVQSEGGPSIEAPTALMFRAMLELGGPQVSSLINEAAEQTIVRRGVKAGAAASHFRTSLIHYFTALYKEKGKEFSDHKRLNVEDWAEPIALLEEDLKTEKSMAIDSMYGDFAILDASTPVPERWYGTDLMSQIAKERFPGGAVALDVGSSIGAGALFAAYKHSFPFAFDQAVLEPLTDYGPLIDITANTNRLLALPSAIKQIVCVDRIPFYNEDRQEWDDGFANFALSGLRPSERNSSYIDVIRSLMDRKRKRSSDYDPDSAVVFAQADLLKPDDVDSLRGRFPQPFDLITANYMTQELSPKQQIGLHTVLCSLLSYNGILMYTHQAQIEPALLESPTDITNVLHDESYASKIWRGNMQIQDNLHPVQGLQQAMNFYDNRGRRVRFSQAGRLMINGKLEPIADLVRHG